MYVSHCVVKLKSVFELTGYAIFARENTVIFKKRDDEVTQISVSCGSSGIYWGFVFSQLGTQGSSSASWRNSKYSSNILE